MGNEHILVVDDEPDILELVRYNLAKDGFRVSTVESGEDALSFIEQQKPDLVLLDLMLPGIDGLEVTKRLRAGASTARLPVVILSAKGDEEDVIAGLELGADDYVPKPFSPKVLCARVRSVLRRRAAPQRGANDVIQLQGIVVNPARREVTISGAAVELTNTEFKLLALLVGHPGMVFTREQIVEKIHGDDYPVTDRSVDVQIVGLRRKMGESGKLIETVRGVGYRCKD